MKIQVCNNLDDEFSQLQRTKTAMICTLTQIPPHIWMPLPLEAKKWLLNERKHQQVEDEKAKKADAISDKSLVKFSDKDPKDVNMPNQYAKAKSVAKGEEMIQGDTEQSYDFVDEFLEEALRSSSLFETEHDLEYDHWSSDHNIHASISISNTLHNKCMNLLFLPEIYQISILDSGADTCVLGKDVKSYLFIVQERQM